jgi:hypothetical protein
MNKSSQIAKSSLTAFALIIISCQCYSQKQPKLPVPFFRDIDKYISVRADSLNTLFKKDTVLPTFIFDRNLDLQLSYSVGSHNYNSLRYLILQRVVGSDVLDYLSYLKEERLFALPDTDSPLPFRKYSMHDLIKYRLNELVAKENYQKFKRNKTKSVQ